MISVAISRRESVVAEQWQQIKTLRSERELQPISTAWGVFQFDEKSQRRLQAVVEACGSGWVSWYTVDNTSVDLSPTDLRSLYYTLVELSGKRVLALGEFTRQLREQLPLREDHPVLCGVGWPA